MNKKSRNKHDSEPAKRSRSSRAARHGSHSRGTRGSGAGKWFIGFVLLGVAVLIAWGTSTWLEERELAEGNLTGAQVSNSDEDDTCGKLRFVYPLDGTVFPPESIPPRICWEDTSNDSDLWELKVEFPESGCPSDPSSEKVLAGVESSDSVIPETLRFELNSCAWTPGDAQWASIKQHSVTQPVVFSVTRLNGPLKDGVPLTTEVNVLTSTDEVGAPIFYREVCLPFGAAVRNPADMIRWRFGPISTKEQPPIILEKMPVCGNCHSFSADGATMGMDVDFASDKGSYTICDVDKDMMMEPDNIITWSDYRKEDKKKTFGLLSQISPDGRYVVSTVKDLSIFLAINDNLAFSQLFFPVQGILCYYDRQEKTFHAIPGADDPEYVQSNPTWSPDGKYLVFARSKAYAIPNIRVHELGLSVPEEVPDFVSGKKKFRFDLYRIPFNGGKGGKAEPLQGASGNGKSNYFAKYSPDGKWIVYCQADSFMLLQPDSELFIIPAEGGEARRLKCNTSRMNSWHSWSPNGKWMVFSSKAFTLYTQLMLTHIDEQGNSTPPVVLSHFTVRDRAANIPEFVNVAPDAIGQLAFDRRFFADELHISAGDRYAEQGEFELAIEQFQKALEVNPKKAYGYRAWAIILSQQGKLPEAEELLLKARDITHEDRYVNWQLGQVLALLKRPDEAEAMYREAIRVDSMFMPPYLDLARMLFSQHQIEKAQDVLQLIMDADPTSPQPYCVLADAMMTNGDLHSAGATYQKAIELDENCLQALIPLAQVLANSPGLSVSERAKAVQYATRACTRTNFRHFDALLSLSDANIAIGNSNGAVVAAKQALDLATKAGNQQQQAMCRARLQRLGQ